MPNRKTFFTLLAAATIAVATAASAQDAADEAQTPFVLPKTGPFNAERIEIENNQAIMDWYRSAHADSAADAFRHWDEDGAIEPVCAVCHSGEGFRAFHGLDGSEPGVPNTPIPTGGVVDCGTCHNAGLAEVKTVTFPSGLEHPVQGVEAACLTCHQGRTAGLTVASRIEGLPLDEPNPELRFVNPHYATAGATWLGGYGGAGYHYDGRDYAGRFFHARPVATCVSCHKPHRLEVAFEPCLTCHVAETPDDIRIARQSFDGSGDTGKGIKSDIETNAALLLDLVLAYSTEVAGTGVVYDGARFPYFFTDANNDGQADGQGREAAFASWTPRMLRAAYNWKLVTADPGNYAHNPAYALQLLHDSIEDLAGPLGIPMSELNLLR